MDIHLIIPEKMSEMMKKTIYNQKSTQDRMDVIELKNGTDEIKKVIKNSRYDYIIVFSDGFVSKEKFLKKAKEELEQNSVFLYTEKHEGDTLPDNCFIGFEKGQENVINKNYRSTLLFIRRMASTLPSFQTKKAEFIPVSKPKGKPKPRKDKNAKVRKEDKVPPKIRSNTTKPKILFICDVKG